MLFVRYIVVLEPFNIISVVLVLMSMLRFSLWSCVDRSNDIGASDVWNCVLCVGWACVSVLHVRWNVCTRVFVCDRVCVCVYLSFNGLRMYWNALFVFPSTNLAQCQESTTLFFMWWTLTFHSQNWREPNNGGLF